MDGCGRANRPRYYGSISSQRRARKMVKQRQSEPVVVYQMKVRLTDIEPPIWRRFLVAGDQSLYRLHLILQTVMGWENYQCAM